MTKILSLILTLIMVVTVFGGCSSSDKDGISNDPIVEFNPVDGDDDYNVSDADNDDDYNVSDADNDDDNEESNNNVDTSDKDYITSKESFVAKVEDLVDVTLYDTDFDEAGEIDSEGSDHRSYYYIVKDEYEKDYDLDYNVELGDGTEFTLPIALSELEDMGWSLTENSQPDYEIESGYSTTGIIENKNGKTLSVSVYNPTDQTVTLKECTVDSIDAQQYYSDELSEKLDEAIDFTVCDSLTNASTLEDIIDRLGAPWAIDCTIWYYEGGYEYTDITVEYVQDSSAYSSIEFELSGDGNYIWNMKYSVEPEMN